MPTLYYYNNTTSTWEPAIVGEIGATGPQGATGPEGPIAGSNTEILFNDAGTAAGDANLIFDKTAGLLTTFELNLSSNADSNSNTTGAFVTQGGIAANGNITGGGKLFLGPFAHDSTLQAPALVAKGVDPTYIQAALINTSDTGSADYAAYSFDEDSCVDIGFTGANFNDANYTITYPNDAYLFSEAGPNSVGGNLVIATNGGAGGADIVFATGGFAVADEFMRISDANIALEVGGNVNPTANVTYDLGNATNRWKDIYLANSTIYLGNSTISENANTGAVVFSGAIVQNTGANAAVSIGPAAGGSDQGDRAVAIGNGAGEDNQSEDAVAIGNGAGNDTQGNTAVAIGASAGLDHQGDDAIAIGQNAGRITQGTRSISIGVSAGETNQGNYSIALGLGAGQTNQAPYSIVLNATGSNLENITQNSFVVKPVRSATTANALYYDSTTGEISYGLAGGGVAGATGATGPAGVDGATGATGVAGVDGATGATGPAGTNGSDGATGASGPGFVWQGAWQPSPTTYVGGQDVVSYAGSSYIKIGDGNSGSAPPDDPVRWSVMAEEGAVGAQGATGANGSDGATGATGPAGTNGSDGATGATGPQGDTGATGPSGIASLPIANGNSNFDIAVADGNVTITANASNTWTFGDDGLLTLPGGYTKIGAQYGSEAILASNVSFGVATQGNATTFINWSDDVSNTSMLAAIYVNDPTGNAGNITVRTGNVGSANVWTFDTTGNVSLPGGGSLYSLPSTPSGAPGNTIVLQPAGPSFITDQKLMVYPTAGDGDHIHMTTGNLYQTELFLGSDNFFVKLSNTGNVVINPNDNISYSATWTFSPDGNLTLANGNSVIHSNPNSSLDPTLPNVSTMTLTPDANYNSQVLVLDPTAPGHIHLRAYAFSNIDDPAANIFLGGENTAFEITQGANNQAVIHSNGKAWTFGNDGNITSDTLTFTTTFANVKTVEYQTAGVWDLYVEDSVTGSNTAISRLNVSFKDNLIDKPQVYIENTKESDGIALRWTFDENGNLNFPRDVAGNSDPYLVINGGSGPAINSVDVSLAGPANLLISSDYLNLTGYNGNRVFIRADDGMIATDANMVLSTNNANVGNTYSWTFDIDGNLTLPGNTFAINFANGTQASAPLVDVLNTNGLTTVFYPTFVENRTDGQIVRADVDLSYRSDTNTLTVGNISTGDITAANLTLNGQQITASGLVNASYLFAINNAEQIGLAANGAVAFQDTQANNGSLINKISNTQVTLTGNNTYRLEGIIKRNSSNDTWSTYQWYDVTNSVYVGGPGFGEAVTSSQTGVSSTIVATAYVTPSTNTTYELRSTVNTVTVNQYMASMEITQINPAILLSAITNLTTTGNVSVGGNLEVSGTSNSIVLKASGLVNNGVDVTLGNLKARLAGSGNRSLQVSTVSGTYSVYGSGTFNAGSAGSNTIDAGAPLTITTTPQYLAAGLNLNTAGYTDTWMIMDTSNTIAWRISLILGAAYNNNMISIERLV